MSLVLVSGAEKTPTLNNQMGSSPKFTRPKGRTGPTSNVSKPSHSSSPSPSTPTPNLYVANCGPAVGLSYDSISAAFSQFGHVIGVYPADDTGTRVVVSFADVGPALEAFSAFNGKPCPTLSGRSLHIRFSVPRPLSPVHGVDSVDVSLTAKELNIPGLYLFRDFISPKEEEELLAAVDSRPWINLAKRRVQHYGYEFCYQIRNVDTSRRLGELPTFVSPILERISASNDINRAATINLDQLTVNEYPSGVGLSPHIDTHSAFEDEIFSLSLAGPCIMEFRKYLEGDLQPELAITKVIMNEENPKNSAKLLRKALYLPPRSMLLLSGEARYAWQHYIPHHKIDNVKDNLIRRATRRVSFTFRKVRTGACQCEYVEYCDSRK